MSVFYFSGKENYLKKQELRKIIDQIECPEMNVMEFYEPVPELYDFACTAPFIGTKKVGILHYYPEQEEFLSAVKDLPDFTDLYIIAKELPDHRKKVVKELSSIMVEREFKKIDDELLFKCIASRLHRYGYSLETISELREVLMDSFRGYSLFADMDLEVVQKHVQMIAFSGALTPETIQMFAPESSDYRAFRLSNMLLSKDPECIRFAKELLEQGEQPIGILSLVAYQIRICYKASLFQDENYCTLIGIRKYQLFDDFQAYMPQKYVEVYSLLMEGIRRVKKGEDASAVIADTLTDALAKLKEV